MLSLRNGRVARRLQILTDLARAKVRAREKLRDAAAALAGIRSAIVDTGVDPVDNPGLTYFAGAERRLAGIGDTPALRAADAAFIAADRSPDSPAPAGYRRLASAAAALLPLSSDRPPPDTDDSPSPGMSGR